MSFDLDFDPDEQDLRAVMHLHRRSISEEQMHKFEADVAAIFEAFGLDLDTPATERTPQRFLRAVFDATEGYEDDPKLLTVFETECRGGPDCRLSQVIEGPIHLEAHHLCTQMRGVRESTPLTRTTFWRGAYDENAALRAEFFDMCGVRQ